MRIEYTKVGVQMYSDANLQGPHVISLLDPQGPHANRRRLGN